MRVCVCLCVSTVWNLCYCPHHFVSTCDISCHSTTLCMRHRVSFPPVFPCVCGSVLCETSVTALITSSVCVIVHITSPCFDWDTGRVHKWCMCLSVWKKWEKKIKQMWYLQFPWLTSSFLWYAIFKMWQHVENKQKRKNKCDTYTILPRCV